MKIGEIIEVEGVKYIAQEEILGCKDCCFEERSDDCYSRFCCKENDYIIFVKIPLELLEKIEQLENQIEKMKNCENCKRLISAIDGEDYSCDRNIGCVKNSKWEFKK